MEFVLIGIVVIIVIAFIAYPLFTASRAEMETSAGALDTLIAQRESTYDALRDLDFDFQLGKLSQSDYQALREKYKARAALTLQQIDALGKGNGVDVDAGIEAQVARLRRPVSADDAIEHAVAKLRAAKNADPIEEQVARLRAARKPADPIENAATAANTDSHCANCGTRHRAGDQFCAKCGNKL